MHPLSLLPGGPVYNSTGAYGNLSSPGGPNKPDRAHFFADLSLFSGGSFGSTKGFRGETQNQDPRGHLLDLVCPVPGPMGGCPAILGGYPKAGGWRLNQSLRGL